MVLGWLPTQELSCCFILQDASFSLAHTLSGHPGLTNSRFGFAMAAVGDINQDKFTDVAIGAPGEQENQGAVYIFYGASIASLSASHSQVRHHY